jgi:uncharacterized protein with HEPN domain
MKPLNIFGMLSKRPNGSYDLPSGRSFDDYLADDMLRAAVERQFEIIGEAFAGLRRIDPAVAARIPDLPRIIAFRNVLIHADATIGARLVWGVVENDLAGCIPRSRSCWERLLGHSARKQMEAVAAFAASVCPIRAARWLV